MDIGHLALALDGRGKGHAARHHRHQRLRLDGHPVGIELRIDAAGLPEARVLPDETVIRTVDEDVDQHVFTRIVQRIAGHPAHHHPPVQHRRTDVQRAQILRAQPVLAARLVILERGRVFQPGERRHHLLRAAGIHPDIGPGQQRAQPGHTGHVGPWPHHPVARILRLETRSSLAQLDVDLHMRTVLGQLDAPDLADFHILVTQLGLARLQPLGRLEGHGDRRPVLGHLAVGQNGAHQCGQKRQQPDQRGQPAIAPVFHLGLWHQRIIMMATRLPGLHRAAPLVSLTATAPFTCIAPGPHFILDTHPSQPPGPAARQKTHPWSAS